jgi:hypothetical protein
MVQETYGLVANLVGEVKDARMELFPGTAALAKPSRSSIAKASA